MPTGVARGGGAHQPGHARRGQSGLAKLEKAAAGTDIEVDMALHDPEILDDHMTLEQPSRYWVKARCRRCRKTKTFRLAGGATAFDWVRCTWHGCEAPQVQSKK